MSKKSTIAQKAKRIEEVKLLMIQGESRRGIIQYATSKWGISERMVDEYVAVARKEYQEDLDAIRPYALAEHIAHRKDLLQRAARSKDYRLELDVAKDTAKLLGLYEDVHVFKNWQDVAGQSGIAPEDAAAVFERDVNALLAVMTGEDANG